MKTAKSKRIRRPEGLEVSTTLLTTITKVGRDRKITRLVLSPKELAYVRSKIVRRKK